MKTRSCCALGLAVALAAGTPVSSQTPATVPPPADIVGHELGERFTDAAGVIRYMERLAEAAPERVRLEQYGETNEGRPLLQAIIARPDHLARLDEILARNAELANLETSEARAEAIIAAQPAVVYFSYGVHGNESSSSEAALYTAYDLVRGAPEVAGVLDSLIVIIDPMVNPDGRERYVGWYRTARAGEANPNPAAREHSEPWPGGRFNHYLFDLNRDWAWLTQRETRARLATWSRLNPQVHVDFHEMSPQSSYFFFPAAAPINPLYPEHILRWGERFGDANARAFDREGWAYYTSESYDLFYPGYGDTWPSLLGAVGMTYEQAGGGRAGLAFRREDGQLLTLRERARHHHTTGIATLNEAMRGRTALLNDFAAFQRRIGTDHPDILLVPGADQGRTDALLALLAAQGIQVERAGRAFRADADPHTGYDSRRDFPAGSYRVPARQPRGLLATALLLPEVELDATFSYDVSAWSLAYAYGVEAHATERVPDAGWQRVAATGDRVAGGVAGSYGVLLPPTFASWPAVATHIADGGRAVVLERGFEIEGRSWPAGTIFLPRAGVDDYDARIARLALPAGAAGVSTGRASRGPDLGTEEAYTLRTPRVALLGGDGVYATSFGAHWFFLEHTLQLDYDVVLAADLGSLPLEDYDVVVAPEMSALEEDGLEALRAWTRAGGTLVAVGSGARTVGSPIADIALRVAPTPPDSTRTARALRGRDARELESWERDVPGTILELTLDASHPLAFGATAQGDDARLFVLHTGGTVFEPDPAFETVAHFGAAPGRISGVISDESLDALANGSWMVTRGVGAGRAILFADDPLFRHFWYAAFQPFANALLIGPTL